MIHEQPDLFSTAPPERPKAKITPLVPSSLHLGPPAFYNTAGETGEALTGATDSAAGQEAVVLKLMKDGTARSASQVYRALNDRRMITGAVPITSIRRAMTNLMKRGILEKLDEKRLGPYGRNEHKYLYRHV